MRPNTLHFVVGLDNTIVHGRHFYATSTIFESCLGIIHTFVLGLQITNQTHERARMLLRRLMTMWLDSYLQVTSVPGAPLNVLHMHAFTNADQNDSFSLEDGTRA